MTRAPDALYAQTLSAAGIGTFEWDLRRGSFRCNEALAGVLGIKPGEDAESGASLRDTVVPEDLAGLDAVLDEARVTGNAIRHSFCVRHPQSGQIRKVVLRARHFNDAAIGDEILIGILADVTVRDEHADSLRLSEEKHRLIFEHNPVPMFIVDIATARFLSVNQAAAALLGWSVTELELMAPSDVLDAAFTPVLEAQLAATDRGLRHVGVVTLRRKDGTERMADVSVDRTTLGGREVIVASAIDVTSKVAVERALRQSEQIFRDGFEAAATPTALLDGTGHFTRVNSAFCTLFRMRADEFEGASFLSLTHPEHRDRDAALVAELRAGTRQRIDIEKKYLRPDGSVIFAHTAAAAIVREEGVATLLLVEIVDQTALRETLAALQRSEERFGLVMDATTDGLWDWDVPSGRMYLNPQWSRMLGYEPDELAPHIDTWLALTHPEDRERAFAALAAHADGRATGVELEIRMRRKDGSWAWILDRGRIVERHTDGSARRVVGTHTDISARREEQEAVVAQKAVMDTVLSNIPILICIIAPEGQIEYVNRHWADVLGWTVDDMRGRDMLAEFYPDPAYREAVIAYMAAATGEWRDWTIRTRDGRELRTAWTNVRLADGRTIGIGQDVSQARASEAERQRLERQVQEAQKLESLGVLAGGIAHDFNNLLVGILGNATLAEESLPEEAQARELVGEVRAAASRASELTRQLLAYAGKGRFVVESVDVSQLVQEMAALLRAAISKHAVLVPELAPSLPSVEADATQLRQIVMNLITNAADALENAPGTIHLRTGEMRADAEFRGAALGGDQLPDGPLVFIEVQDSGRGMDGATLQRIFDPFFTTKFTGRGLGLAATLGIIRSHKGAIHVRSAPGAGTTIRIALPGRLGVSTPLVGTVAALQPEWKGEGEILVADDEAYVRRVARRALERAGFRVAECADGREAADLVAANPTRFCLVLLDLTMPRLAGDDALREIRRINPALPAVLYSGYSSEELDATLTGLPNVRFLQKPFSMAELTSTVRAAMRRVDA